MDIEAPCALLGGLSPTTFMRRHWQKKPLRVRQALPGVVPPLSRPALFALAASEEVESRLVVHDQRGWRLRHGPLPRRALPPLRQPGWTVLVQGVDLHVPAARSLLERFRFIPDARLDDLMISWASDTGGVGPHRDSYDVFLVQIHGRRRWRIGRCRKEALVEGLPLKILRHFEPEQEWLLEPGDLLYLPPGWAHDGVAEGECMTASVGFRAPARRGLAADLLGRLSEALAAQAAGPRSGETRYRDPSQRATDRPGGIPPPLQAYARQALQAALADPRMLDRALGEFLTEPGARVWFEAPTRDAGPHGLRLADRSRMLYDRDHVYLNGESFRARGRDALTMQGLADRRVLSAAERRRLSPSARALVNDWLQAGWLEGCDDV
jgi:50S ribosomal protein L16 3-hydroxylase